MALTVGSPIVFPIVFTIGTISSIRDDVHEHKYGAAVLKGAALTLTPAVLPIGALGTIGTAPVIAIDIIRNHAATYR